MKSLKRDKCRDQNGLIYEIFLTEVTGKDLKVSLIMLFNRIKISDKIPSFMKVDDISIKGKSKKNNLNNERGIFVVSTFSAILLKLLYNDNVDTLEENMSTSQVGGGKI